jgi:hypothetical protein
MKVLEEYLVGNELKLLSHKVHAYLVRNLCIGHSQITKNAKNCVTHGMMASSFMSHLRITKNSASSFWSFRVLVDFLVVGHFF